MIVPLPQLALAALLASNAVEVREAGPTQDSAFTGSYTIESGKYQNGQDYTGTVVITEQGGVYRVKWDMAGIIYEGVGALVDGALAVAWARSWSCSLVVYRQEGARLHERKVSLEAEQAPEREWIEIPSTREAKTYQPASARKNDGTMSTLTVHRTGATYQLTWNVLDATTTATGVAQGSILVTGGNGCGALLYTRRGDKLEGRWAASGTTLGTETLVKRLPAK